MGLDAVELQNTSLLIVAVLAFLFLGGNNAGRYIQIGWDLDGLAQVKWVDHHY